MNIKELFCSIIARITLALLLIVLYCFAVMLFVEIVIGRIIQHLRMLIIRLIMC